MRECAGFAYIFFRFRAQKNPLFFAWFRLLKGPKHEIFERGFLHKSDAYGLVTWGLAKKIEISKVGVIILRFSPRMSYEAYDQHALKN